MLTSITLHASSIPATTATVTATQATVFSGKVVRVYVSGTSDNVDLDVRVLAGNNLPATVLYTADDVDSTAGAEASLSGVLHFDSQLLQFEAGDSNEAGDTATAVIIIDTDG